MPCTQVTRPEEWHVKQYGKNSVTSSSMPVIAATRSVNFRGHFLVWLLAATHPAEGQTLCAWAPWHRGTLTPGPIKHVVGRHRKMGKRNGAKENGLPCLLSSSPFPRPPPAPNSWGSRVTLFCGDVEQDLFGGGGVGGVGGVVGVHSTYRLAWRQVGKAGERARTCPGFESLSDVINDGLEATNISRIRTRPYPFQHRRNLGEQHEHHR